MATREAAKIKGGGLYMPFSGIKMSRLFKMNKSAAYNLGMPFLTKLFQIVSNQSTDNFLHLVRRDDPASNCS